jgi:hypothetical protein
VPGAYFISYFSALGMEPAFLKIRNDIILILIEFFHLPKVEDDTIWEDDRNKFLKLIEKKK